jgi:hypothetical protein
VALLLLAGALVLATTGTGGFSSAAADRSVSVAVVGDEAAYLGVERDVVRVDGDPTLRVNVTNRFPSVDDLSVTVDVGDESQTRTVTGSHTFEFPADCDASVHVTADGPGTHVELTRPVPCVESVDDDGDADDTDDGDADDTDDGDADDTDDGDGDAEDADDDTADDSADDAADAADG